MKNLIKNIMMTVLVEAITLWSVMYAVEEINICYTEDWIFLIGHAYYSWDYQD